MNGVPIIAIVDDDASVRRALLRVVQSAGYIGKTFASGREFLAWPPHGQAACLLLDVLVDGRHGFDGDERLTVPTVFISGDDDAPTLERIEKSRAMGHLRQPFDRASVLAAIQRAVGSEPSDHRLDPDEGGES